MRGFLAVAAALLVFSLVLNHGISNLDTAASAWEDKDFFSHCPPSRCSEHGPEVRFPFQLESNNTPSACGVPCMKLSCSGQDTILDIKNLGRPYKVTAIDYKHALLTVVPFANEDKSSSSPCQLLKSIESSVITGFSYYDTWYQYPCKTYDTHYYAAVVSCSTEFALAPPSVPGPAADFIAGPISYLVDVFVPMSLLPLDCEVISDGPIPIPAFNYPRYAWATFRESAERILNFSDTTIWWYFSTCAYYCELQGRRCAFGSQRNQTFCMSPGSRVKVIAATSSVAAFVVLLLMVATALYLSLKTRYNEEIHLKVEMFLKMYGASKPTRYTFSEVKKIARRFKAKVGQGGFGSVYRGELPNGVPVAVKMLENSEGEGDEFINEVATIGRIHHANIVRLLGFCSEGTRRALIYELMPNDSLEKYIFSHDSNTSEEVLVPNKMLDIALGIARGMEYLHQGCNQRILHFDIKPHNILLDYNFSPKISDFGLAKLCARDQSIVTLTAARGTMGYIAPELYSRNFGEISYKSDVYSFGMLVLEMVSGRRNSDPNVENQNVVYFPEWIYEQVTAGQDLALGREMTQEEKATMRQLAIVALWCIQWNPKNRPSMTKVVNMLTGRFQNLQVPPKPFFSADSHPALLTYIHKMSVLPLAAALVIASSILLNHGGNLARAWDDKDFFSHCPPSRCSEHGPEIRFPYSLESSNTSSLCRASCMNLTCSGQDTIVYHPSLGPWKVTAIDYRRAILTIISLADTSSLFPCPVPKFIASTNHEPYGNYPGSCAIYNTIDTILVQCSTEFIPTSNVRGSVADGIAGPFSCISNATRFSYLLAPYVPMSLLPLGCEVVSDHPISMPAAETCDPFTGNCYDNSTFKEKVGRILSFTETMVDLQLLNNCWLCERRGRRCAFSSQRNQTFCMPHGSHVKVIAATSSAAAFVVILLMVTIALYLSLKKRYNKEVHLKVEMFLQTYGTSKPTRYNFSEVKKIARRFKDKVGQGGFGSVYRGELPNGVPVAVKMLESSKGEGEEFINEVATIGRIHHANIVRLLGFCSEGTRRALIYEFMPNDSLEKYIFPCDSNTSQELQVPNKMLGVALGIARGMEYLHQGCNQRILHFDIKPNNILLDYNFSPKISDFGLAKLCARDQSVVTLTAARGTMGYIAPELYSQNFGEISYKSDVYSFGMLVLEMVSGRRNSDPSVESQNEVYFPEWIYEQVNDSRRERNNETAGHCGIMVHSMEPKEPAINDKGGEHANGKVARSADGVHTENRMRGFVAAALLVLSLLLNLHTAASAWEDKDFFKSCPPSRCSEHGPEIRFPFQLESNNNTTPSSCGLPCMKLSCSGQDTILHNKYSYLGRPYKVTAIDYKYGLLIVVPLADEDNSSSSPCPLLKSIMASSAYYDLENPCQTYDTYYAALVSCSTEFALASVPGPATDNDYIAGPISCLSNQTHFSYLVAYHVTMSLLPLDCEVVSDGFIPIPAFRYPGYAWTKFRGSAERILNFSETTVWWNFYDCLQCEQQGGRCAFSSQRNQTFCIRRGSHVKVIAATSSVAAFVVLLLMVATALYLSLKTRYNEEIHLKVEMFLKTYGTSKPTRYTFSEVKKISRRFKVKVGQGGFGSVYRGELPNGVPVAVKMLENSLGEGDEFINEVATIGRIHHANIVRLLGFCSEGTRRALIYEYMPNDSLEKYIFSHDSDTSQQLLVPSKMLDIALGIARGMEYLHQGCNQRILHFDIKPNNILLDYNFSPKISDFGLAKLCARDQSIVTLTAARGTMGYIAPELYSRNFGEISYKSDVYSFGMLVLEMVSGRRNSDPSVESQNVVYFPEWIYEQVTIGRDLELGREMSEEEKATMRQLAIVALWCIQWNPKNRPSMTKVVNMLTGRLQNLQVPPKPFFSADSHPVLQDLQNMLA
uniref:Protein kinase domain-containing protein n=1 Tax=Oryza nivara TaxID=4536 RepID=A0A0E0FFF0_ORYNI